ncbi:MAG: hypothetical protein AAF583_03890 [Pseudomonadota bacterium]
MQNFIVIDAGKTHVRAFLCGDDDLQLLSEINTPSYYEGPVRCLDISNIETWLLETLSGIKEKDQVSAIIPVTHGAAFAILGPDGKRKAPVIDYEALISERISQTYSALRPAFCDTGSPELPLGLNLGRQLEWARELGWMEPKDCLVPYPQYFASFLSGVATSEVSSLGCHTDLWNPWEGGWSNLAISQGWAEQFAPIERADARVGPISPSMSSKTGLPTDTQIYCGLHDSNAALIAIESEVPKHSNQVFISTGTWHVIFAPQANEAALKADLDMLVNVRPDGSPLPSARFMGGREMAAIAGNEPRNVRIEKVQSLITEKAHALPSFSESGGPFQGRRGSLPKASEEDRQALAILYAVLMWDFIIDALLPSGAPDQIGLEGSAATALATQLLARLRPNSDIRLVSPDCSPAMGAYRLVRPTTKVSSANKVEPAPVDGLATYRDKWRALIGEV